MLKKKTKFNQVNFKSLFDFIPADRGSCEGWTYYRQRGARQKVIPGKGGLIVARSLSPGVYEADDLIVLTR